VAEQHDLSWHQYGACRGKPTAWWFPPRGSFEETTTQSALALCDICPVRQQCLAWGLAHEWIGIWGGTSERERKKLRRRAGIKLRSLDLDPRSVAPPGPVHEAPDPFEVTA